MSGSPARDIMRRLSLNQSPVIVALCVVSTGLVALAAYFWSVVDKARIPITPGLAEAATFLPVANFVALRYLTHVKPKPSALQRSGQAGPGRPEWTVKTGIISILLVIIDTIVVTQSMNNIPKSSIACPLERTWRNWYHTKDAAHIKAVQDALHCCGFNTVKDSAWPFPDNNTQADACSKQTKTRTPCSGPWADTHQLSASVFMAVAVATLLSKGLVFVAYRMRSRQPLAPTHRLLAEGSSRDNRDEGSNRAIAGLRIRPDERARNTADDDDDVESIIDENSRLLDNGDRGNYQAPGRVEGGERPILSGIDNGVWDNEYSRAPR